MKSKSFLGVDFGAGTLKVAEFMPTETGGLCLCAFGSSPLGLAGAQDAAREGVVKKSLQRLVTAENGFTARDIYVSAPGFQVFSKFVKLPPVDTSKVSQIIQYEAQQNVPFPLEEVAWDYQILEATGSGELEVLLVAIKTDLVDKLFKTAEANNLRLGLVDVSPAALCNAFRYNYGDLEGCTMLLDIGAKTSNLLFFEGGRVYSRSINIGANAITQEYANETKTRFAEAEKFKLEEGFVSLGGAYEDPDNPRQAQISKVARQVMTRLHIQVNQTMQFYRSQQGGAAPQRLFLAGGASVMPYTMEFFKEKLNLEVDYFNPFREIEFDAAVDLEELAKVAHTFGETVGLGLRQVVQCPVELNLMPRASIKRQEFNQKKPYLLATFFVLVLFVAAFGWFFSQVAQEKLEKVEILEEITAPLDRRLQLLRPEKNKLDDQFQEVEELSLLIQERYFWSDVLREIRASLLDAESLVEKQTDKPAGIWIASLKPNVPDLETRLDQFMAVPSAEEEHFEEDDAEMQQQMQMQMMMMMDPNLAGRYGMMPGMGGMAGGATEVDEDEGMLTELKLICKGVNLGHNNNQLLGFAVLDQLRARSELFDPEQTNFSEGGELQPVGEMEATFQVSITVRLVSPLKLDQP